MALVGGIWCYYLLKMLHILQRGSGFPSVFALFWKQCYIKMCLRVRWIAQELASKTVSFSWRLVSIPVFLLATISSGGEREKIRRKGVGTAASSRKYFSSANTLPRLYQCQSDADFLLFEERIAEIFKGKRNWNLFVLLRTGKSLEFS